MAPSGLRESHLSHLRAAASSASSSRSASPDVSREHWLRSQEQLIKDVDPSFDSSLLCPISLHSPSSPGPHSPAQYSPAPSASSSYPSPLGTPSAASRAKASSAVALPSSLFWPSPGQETNSNSNSNSNFLPPNSAAQWRARALKQEEDGRSLLKSTSSPLERIPPVEQPAPPAGPGSGPQAPSHVSEQQQQASRVGAGAARHRLSQSRGSHLQSQQRPALPSAAVEGPASPASQDPAGSAGCLAAPDVLQRTPAAASKPRGRLSLDQSDTYPAPRGKADANLDNQSTIDTSSAYNKSPSRAYHRHFSAWREQGTWSPVANSFPEGNGTRDKTGENDLATTTEHIHPGLNFQDAQRASEELDRAGELIDSITIIAEDDSDSQSGRSSSCNVLFAISSTKRQ